VNPGNRTYACSDGEISVRVENAEQWHGLAVAIGRPELSYEGAWDAVRAAEPDGPVGRVVAEHFTEDNAETWGRRLTANEVPYEPGA
jgi:crotonobetainyl-CoA:carnitine CoA-transferase CaiB-like acyl-CoA transferase